MYRAHIFIGVLWLLIAPANAGEVLLPAIGPSLQVPQPEACPIPCDETAALDGNFVAVSRITPTAPGGEVAIYSKQGQAWIESVLLANPAPCLAPPPPPDQDPLPCWDPVFGLQLALSGDYLFASAEAMSVREPRVIYVFRRAGEQWLEQQRIELPAPAVPGLQSFRTTAIEADGRTLAIGSTITELRDGETRSLGSVQLFHRGRDGQYRLVPVDTWLDAQFTFSLALHKDTLVVGPSEARGEVYVFQRGPTGWKRQQKLTPSLPGQQSFGGAIAVSADTIAVGAPSYFPDNFQIGRVYIYKRFHGRWSETQVIADPIELEEPGPNNLRYFGTRLALQGRHLMIGIAPAYPRFLEKPQVLLFERQRHSWQPVAEFLPYEQPFRIQLSGRSAVIVTSELRFGNYTYLYEIPKLEGK